MKNRRTKLAGALLAAVLLTGCGTTLPVNGSAVSEAVPVHTGTIAYVPLDDRPDNVERVEYLAESLGYTVEMPKADWYQTRLDGQPTNQNGTQYGDRAALYEWVLSEEESGCDLYVLSLDQLLSGGLVNSRSMTGENPVTLSDGTVLTESEMENRLLTTLRADPNNQVWLLDTVMRLAPTMGYDGMDLEDYNALRSYGMLARPELSGDALTVDHIAADYSLGSDGNLAAIQSDTPLPDKLISNYLAARERKLQLSDELLQTVSGSGYEQFHVLIGIDDSSAEDSVQKNEIAYLRKGLRSGRDWLLSGVDDLGFKAVTKLYQASCGWTGAAAAVTYFGGMEDQAACDYDYQPLREIVEEHLNFLGLTETDDSTPSDLQVLVLTQPAEETRKTEYAQALIDTLNDCEKQGRPTILIDAGNGLYGTAFHDALVKQSNLGWLLSYSGFLDMAIVSGTALSNGVARYAWLRYGTPSDEAANQAFLKALSDSVIKDFCYKNTVRDDLIGYIQDTLGGSADNFYDPTIDLDATQQALESGMAASTQAVLHNFSHSNFVTALEPYTESGCGALSLSDYSFPWNRVFEIRMQIDMGCSTNIHKKLFGFFYT